MPDPSGQQTTDQYNQDVAAGKAEAAATAPADNSGGPDSGPILKSQGGYLWQFVPDPLGLTQGQWTRVGLDPANKTTGAGSGVTAAHDALMAFLQAQSLADARKLAAMDEFQKLGKFALPAGAKNFPGYEPGGMAQTLAARQGLSQYTPPPLTTQTVNPGEAKLGDVPPEVMQMIQGLAAKGGV